MVNILPQPPLHIEILAKTANDINILLVIMIDAWNLEGIASRYAPFLILFHIATFNSKCIIHRKFSNVILGLPQCIKRQVCRKCYGTLGSERKHIVLEWGHMPLYILHIYPYIE